MKLWITCYGLNLITAAELGAHCLFNSVRNATENTLVENNKNYIWSREKSDVLLGNYMVVN